MGCGNAVTVFSHPFFIVERRSLFRFWKHCFKKPAAGLSSADRSTKTMSSANTYYYEQLNKEGRQVYHAMLNGLTAIEPSFAVPRLDGKNLAEIYFLVRMDHPEIFYTTRFTYRYYKDADSVELIPDYLFPKAKIREHQLAMNSRVKKIINQAAALKTEEDKVLFVHDFLVEHVYYDKLKKPYSHEIIGALGNGVAVCEGIAKSVKVLLDAMGIWCILALADNNPQKGIKYRHTWNLVKLGKTYYHLDATFDNSLTRENRRSMNQNTQPEDGREADVLKTSSASGQKASSAKKQEPLIRRDYCLLSDTQIYRDHEPSMYRLPACTVADHSYYRTKKLSFTKMEEVLNRTGQAIRKKKPLVFHWRGGYLTRKVLIEMLGVISEAALEKDRQAFVSVNWPQAVVFVHFADLTEEQKAKLTAEKKLLEGEIPEKRRDAETDTDVPSETEEQLRKDLEGILQMEEANEGERYEGE